MPNPTLRIAAKSLDLQRIEVILPQFVLALTVIVKGIPRIDTGVVQVIEVDADGVIADRLDTHDADMASPGDDGLLARPVALDLRRRAFDPQKLGPEREGLAVLKVDFEDFPLALEADNLCPVLEFE